MNSASTSQEDLYFSQPDYYDSDSDNDTGSSTTVVVDYDLAEPIVIEGEFFDALLALCVVCA